MKAWGKGLEKSERGVKKKEGNYLYFISLFNMDCQKCLEKTGKNFD